MPQEKKVLSEQERDIAAGDSGGWRMEGTSRDREERGPEGRGYDFLGSCPKFPEQTQACN